MASEFEDALRRTTVEQINNAYHNQDMDAGERNWMLREKARVTLKDSISREGSMGAAWEIAKEEFSKGWDELRQASSGEDKGIVWNNVRSLLGAMRMWGSLTHGAGSVLGMNVEEGAIAAGLSPGLARTLNSIAWFGVQIVPVGAGAQVVGRGVRGAAVAASKLAGKEAPGLSKAVVKEIDEMAAVADGLAMDGVKNAHEVIETSARVAGQTEVADGLKQIREVSEKVAMPVAQAAKSPAKAFSDSVVEHLNTTAGLSDRAVRDAIEPLMRKFGISRRDINSMRGIAGRKVMGPRNFYANLKALEEHGAQLSQLAKEATKEGATLADQTAFMQYATGLFTNSTDRTVLTKAFQDLLIHWDPTNVAKGDFAAAIKTFAGDMAQLSARQAAKFTLNNQQGFLSLNANWWGIAKEGWQNLLLPASWVPAAVSNTISTSMAIATRAAGGDPRGAVYYTQGMKLAIGDALRAGWIEGFVKSQGRNVIPGWTGQGVNAQRDSLIAADAFAKTIMKKGYLYAEAMYQAHQRGVTNVGGFVNQFVNNPPIPILNKAIEIADKGTFNNDLGRMGQRLTGFLQDAGGGAGSLYYTFVKSAINLGKYSWTYTPGLQLISRQLWRDLASGGTAATDAMGRLTIGSLMGMFAFEMAKNGNITGSGPADPALRKAWQATHEPFSVGWEGGPWISFQNVMPLQQVMGFVAEVAEIHDQLDDFTKEQAGLAIAMSFMHNFGEYTLWRQLADMVETVRGMERGQAFTKKGMQTILGPAITATTLGPGVSRMAKVFDPVARDARTLTEMWKARIPGYSKTVAPLRDGFGDPVIPPTTPGTPWFGYFLSPIIPKMQPEETDPVKKEAYRLKIHLPYFSDHIGQGELAVDPETGEPQDQADVIPALLGAQRSIAIKSDDRERWQQIYRNVIRGETEENPGLKGLMASEGYNTDPETGTPTTDAYKRELFQGFVNNAKKTAAQALLVERPHLMEQNIVNQYQEVMPKRPAEVRPELMQQQTEAIDSFRELQPEAQENLLQWGILEPDKPYKKPSVNILGIEALTSRGYEPVNPQTGQVGR